MEVRRVILDLPAPDTQGIHSLVECTRTRRSIREYSDSPIPIQHLSRLLWAAQGVTRPDGKRTTPSAGGLYPLQLRVLVRRVEGLEPGIYDYLGDSHSLKIAGGLPSDEIINAVGIGDQPWLAESAAVLGVVADLAGTVRHFESQPPVGERGKRYVYMETGALTQNVHLHATDLELGCVLVAGFDDTRAREALKLSPEREPMALLCLGKLQ
ncbi:SagB/ThcOx family dehydrogenase [Marinobacter sp. M1N3S26]|uniref:SagB/ThcOx family dehydrogenase n=1 Tax=Marinobacter sp. M1N3S26 TaxID=3382299 RepID=UPI00387AB7F8